MKNNSYDPNKMTWMNPNIEYLFNDDIIEYDMKDAGFSLIKQHKLLPPDVIRSLELLGKGEERNIAVGKLRGKDRVFSKSLSEKFAAARKVFLETNQIGDERIISVKNDAIFVIGRVDKTTFGTVQFRDKNIYSSYLRFPSIRDLEIYYSSQKIDVKGMGEGAANRHRFYMLNFLKDMISLIEVHDSKAKRKLINFIDSYKSGELDIEYYVEFNNVSRNVDSKFNYMNILIPLSQIIMREMM